MKNSTAINSIISRKSARAFLPTPVESQTIKEILQAAAKSPSGANSQPWFVYVVQGQKRAEIIEKVCKAHDEIFEHPERETNYRPDYDYYPRHWVEPYLSRRRQCGLALYELLGISKEDREKTHTQHGRNFKFFDAPVGIFITMNRVMGQGSFLDCGMFMQSIMIAANSLGLSTCPQAAWNDYASIVLPQINASAEEILVGAIALGFEDRENIANKLSTPRQELDEFVKWLD